MCHEKLILQFYSVNHSTHKYLKTNYLQVIQELEKVLKMIESKKNISVTLLTSDCGSLYSDLDLRPLLDDNIDKTNVAAYETAESIR